jgi:spore germination protein GerM
LLLEVFQYSPKDGTEIDKSAKILIFQGTEKQKVSLYYPNSRQTKGFQCAQVFAIETNIDKTTDPAKNTLTQLFKGPTDKDLSKGYSTSLSSDLTINNFKIDSQTALLDLNKNISLSSEKCKIASAIAQISQTLKQFPEIKNVKISINNNPLN